MTCLNICDFVSHVQPSESGVLHLLSLDCPPGYTLAQAPQETGYVTCLCNLNNDLILQCDGRSIDLQVFKISLYNC